VDPAPDIDGEQDGAHGKGIDEPVDEQKDRSGDEEDPIRQGKEESADEKARDEGGGYRDAEPIECEEEDLKETDQEFAHRLPVKGLKLHAGITAEVAASALGEIDIRVGLGLGDLLEVHGLGGFAVVRGPAVFYVVKNVLALDRFEVEDEVIGPEGEMLKVVGGEEDAAAEGLAV